MGAWKGTVQYNVRTANCTLTVLWRLLLGPICCLLLMGEKKTGTDRFLESFVSGIKATCLSSMKERLWFSQLDVGRSIR